MTYKSFKKQAVEDLENYYYLKRQQENLPKQLKILKSSTLYTGSSMQPHVALSGSSDRKMIAHISRIENAETQLENINHKLAAMENAFEFLEESEKQLLFSYYVNRQRQSVMNLSVTTNTERSWLYRKADRALKKYISAFFGTFED